MIALILGNPHLRSPWLGLGLTGLMMAVVYAQIFQGLLREWLEFPSLSHGFAIPLISAYLVWARHSRIVHAPLATSLWGLPILLLGLAALVVGVRGEETFLARLSFPVTLFGLTLLLAGWEVIKQTWMAIAYLTFMIPLPWTTLAGAMDESRLLDAILSAQAVRLLGVPIHRDGVLLHLPNATLEVAGVCTSVPAIAALLSLAAAYVVLTKRPLWIRSLLLLAIVPLAVISNTIRIATTAFGVYYIGVVTLSSFYHKFTGTVTFVIAFILLLGIDAMLLRTAGWRSR